MDQKFYTRAFKLLHKMNLIQSKFKLPGLLQRTYWLCGSHDHNTDFLYHYLQSDNIFSVIYSNPWISLPQFLKKYIIITNNQRSLVIRAGKLIPVSIQTFAKVTWSYNSDPYFKQTISIDIPNDYLLKFL